MATEEEIKQLAYTMWEQEGRPEGKHLEHYFTAKRILEEEERRKKLMSATQERSAKMSPKRILVVDDRLIDRIDQYRGDASRAEFLEICLDRCLEELQPEGAQSEEKRTAEREPATRYGEETVTRKEFLEFKRSVRDLMMTYLDFVTAYRPEARTGGATQEDLEQIRRRLRTIASEV